MKFTNPFARKKANRAPLESQTIVTQEHEIRVLKEELSNIGKEYNRLGTVRLDTLVLEARVRAIVPDIKIEGPAEPVLWVIKTQTTPSEGEVNAIRGVFQEALEINRT